MRTILEAAAATAICAMIIIAVPLVMVIAIIASTGAWVIGWMGRRG